MRHQVQIILVAMAAATVIHCAQGSTGTGGTGDDGDNDVTSGYSLPTTTNATTGTGHATTGDTTSSSEASTGSAGTTATGTTSQASTSQSSSQASTSVSSSSGGPVVCDPTNPGPGCGANMHCVPTEVGDPVCEAPVGAGGPYAACATRAECGAALECVNDGTDTCCMTWCSSDGDCGGAETCTFLNTPVYVGAVEYGVCWDGLPCVL
jgi:hypothetical protein